MPEVSRYVRWPGDILLPSAEVTNQTDFLLSSALSPLLTPTLWWSCSSTKNVKCKLIQKGNDTEEDERALLWILNRASVFNKSTYITKNLVFFTLQQQHVKVVPVNAMKTYRERRRVSPLILNLDTRHRWVVNCTPRPLCPQERTPFTMNRRLAGPQSRCGRFGNELNLMPLPGFEPRIVQPVA
jgi:hypothetical protein